MTEVNLALQLFRCFVQKVQSFFKLSLSNYTRAFEFIWVTATLWKKVVTVSVHMVAGFHTLYWIQGIVLIPWSTAIAQLILPTTGTVIEVTR